MESKQGKKIKVYWNDAKMYHPKNRSIELSKMSTTGMLEEKTERGLIIKNPITVKIKTGLKHPETNPYYYFIPNGMIISVTDSDESES